MAGFGWWNYPSRFSRASLGTIALLIAGACGCSDKPVDGPIATKSASPNDGESHTPSTPPKSAAPAPKDLVRTDEAGRKWLGDIPYDVWFKDPLAVAGNLTETPSPTNVVATKGTDTAEPKTDAKSVEKTPAKDAAVSSSATVAEWDKLIPGIVVEAETKNIRNALTQALQTVGTYNGNYKTIPVDASTLAALAEIISEQPGAVAWKERAPVVRDLAARIAEAADGLGKEPFDAATVAFDQLIVVLDGGKPTEVAPPEPNVPFADLADRGGLMERMNRAYTWLKQNVGKESDLTAKAENAAHEAAMLAALGKVISHTSYGSADEADYQTHAAGMVEASRHLQEAINTMNYSGFQDSLNQVQQRCDQCHKKYRFGNEL